MSSNQKMRHPGISSLWHWHWHSPSIDVKVQKIMSNAETASVTQFCMWVYLFGAKRPLPTLQQKIQLTGYMTKSSHEYMRVVLNSFIWKTSSSPIFFSFAELSRTPCFSFAVHVGEDFKKNLDVWYPQIVPGVWSLVTLHSAAAALKHLRSALRCWSLLTFIGQFWHNKSTV